MWYLAPLTAYDTPFDPAVHSAANSISVFSARVFESRSGLVVTPGFSVDRDNPGIDGLSMTPGSYWTISEDGTEIARGRLTGLPTDIGKVTATLEFLCLPPDDTDVLIDAADALRVGEDFPYNPTLDESVREAAERYDPLYFNTQASLDPTNVLLARRHLWRWNRLTLVPELIPLDVGNTTSTVTTAFKDSLSFRVKNPPKNKSRLRVVAGWTQVAKGKQLMPHTQADGDGFLSYTYQDLLSQVPKPGDPIGSNTGWSFADFSMTSTPAATPITYAAKSENYGDAAGNFVTLRGHLVEYTFWAAYDYAQDREELLTITMPSATQMILGDLQVENIETLTLGRLDLDLVTPEWSYEDPVTLDRNHFSVGDRVQAAGLTWSCVLEHDATPTFSRLNPSDGTTPLWEAVYRYSALRDLRAAQFFDLERGQRALRYAVRRLDRVVCERGLAAVVGFECPLADVRDLTTGDSVTLTHNRLIGGECTGIINSIELDIAAGSRTARVEILCGIGDGSAPAVAEEGQYSTGGVVYYPTYPTPVMPEDPSMLATKAPYANDITHAGGEQESAAYTAESASLDPVAAIASLPTQIHIAFEPIRQEDKLTRRIDVVCEPITITKGITIS